MPSTAGKENAEQVLQASKAEVDKLTKDLADIQAGKASIESELKQRRADLKISGQELDGARQDRDAARKEIKQLQSTKSELESASARVKVPVFHQVNLWQLCMS